MTDAPRPGALHLYLACPDAPAALRWLERAFARAHPEWHHRCRVLDPEGHEWTFATLRPAESAY